MADIVQDFPIKTPPDRVYQAVTTPAELDRWWTKRSSGTPVEGATYELWFGPQYDWRAEVARSVPGEAFELRMLVADGDWLGTRVEFRLEHRGGMTWVRFSHTGWPSPNEHYRVSCHCWALYLRILRRYLEHDELVPYEDRLDV
jgi:uncharacterized protein YndB with AHSA1/START domain